MAPKVARKARGDPPDPEGPGEAGKGDELSEAEREFRLLLTRPKAYAEWAKGVRAEWMRRRKE